MVERGLRVVEEAQRNPAGEEFRLAEVFAGRKPMLPRHLISKLPGVAVVGAERSPGDDPPLDPPCLWLAERVRVSGRPCQDLTGKRVAVELAVIPCERILHRQLLPH